MAEKNLKELLNKYVPSAEYDQILRSGIVTRSRVDKKKRILEVYADFKYIIPKDTLYALEYQVTDAYKLSFFKILPHYPQELFSESYIPEIIKEAERIGIVARGFFDGYDYMLSNDVLNIKSRRLLFGFFLLFNS